MAADALIGLDLLRADPRFSDLDGSGYSVVVIDHGIAVDHPFFGPDQNQDGVADRIVFQHDFGDDDPSAQEDNLNGHGTSVASILASQDPAHPGVAPGVTFGGTGYHTSVAFGSGGMSSAGVSGRMRMLR